MFVQRFFPSEYGNDVDHTHGVDPAKWAFGIKAQLRRTTEAEAIPYTYVVAGCFSSFYLPTLAQFGLTAPPRDKIIITGNGTPKGISISISLKPCVCVYIHVR